MKTVVQLAKQIARKAHAGQFRRDGITPYIEHPRAVAWRLRGESPEVIAVAWLHDVIEDSPELLDLNGLPKEVVQSVLDLTKSYSDDYSDYIKRVKANPIAKKVKIADMLSNLADDPTEKQILKYCAGLKRLIET